MIRTHFLRASSTSLFAGRGLLLLLATASLSAGCEGAPPDAGVADGVVDAPDGVEAVVSHGLAESHVEANADVLLDEIGARVSALPSGEKAQEFVKRTLEEYGLADVRYEPFPLLAWDRRSAELAVVDAGGAEGPLNILSLGHVGSFDVEAPLVDAGFGTAEEIEGLGAAVDGAIVLADVGSPEGYGRGVHRTEKVTLATEAGAAGFIQLNTQEGPRIPVGVATIGDYRTEIPAVAADRATGEHLRGLMEDGAEVVVRLEVDNWMERAEAANVLADIRGTGDEVILVGAHLDSWDLATGAVDNATGTLATLELARILAEHVERTGQPPERTIRIAFWMGEELGLYGSRYHVDEKAEASELDRYRAVLNLDGVGNPEGFGSMARPEAEPYLLGVAGRVRAAGVELDDEVGTGGGIYSDHQPFLLQGIPILSLRSRQPEAAGGVSHTIDDTRERIDEPGIHRSAAVSAGLLWWAATVPEFPLERWPEGEIGRHLEALGVRDPLERSGEWRW